MLVRLSYFYCNLALKGFPTVCKDSGSTEPAISCAFSRVQEAREEKRESQGLLVLLDPRDLRDPLEMMAPKEALYVFILHHCDKSSNLCCISW